MLNLWSIYVVILCITSSTLAQVTTSTLAYPTASALPQVQAQTNPGCLQGWSYFSKSNKCLKVFGTKATGDAPLTWSQAENFCNRFNGGHLAALKSDDETTFAVELSQATGYNDGDQSRIFIGLFFSGASGWGHPDGTSYVYARWYSAASDGREDGRYPSGVLITRSRYTGYVFVNDDGKGNSLPLPFICQAAPYSKGEK